MVIDKVSKLLKQYWQYIAAGIFVFFAGTLLLLPEKSSAPQTVAKPTPSEVKQIPAPTTSQPIPQADHPSHPPSNPLDLQTPDLKTSESKSANTPIKSAQTQDTQDQNTTRPIPQKNESTPSLVTSPNDKNIPLDEKNSDAKENPASSAPNAQEKASTNTPTQEMPVKTPVAPSTTDTNTDTQGEKVNTDAQQKAHTSSHQTMPQHQETPQEQTTKASATPAANNPNATPTTNAATTSTDSTNSTSSTNSASSPAPPPPPTYDMAFFEPYSDGNLMPKGHPSEPSYVRFSIQESAHSKKEGPTLFIVLSELGLERDLLEFANQHLPKEVAFALFSATVLSQEGVTNLHQSGRELLVHIPMEPERYPEEDPGFNSLLTNLGDDENERRLYYHLSRFQGYIGAFPFKGNKFATLKPSYEKITKALAIREIGYLEPFSFPTDATPWKEQNLKGERIKFRLIDGAPTEDFNQKMNEVCDYLKDGKTSIVINIIADQQNILNLKAFLEALRAEDPKKVPNLMPLSALFKNQTRSDTKSTPTQHADKAAKPISHH